MMLRLFTTALFLAFFLSNCGIPRLAQTSDEFGGIRTGARWAIAEYGIDSPLYLESRKAEVRKMMESYCAPNPYRVVKRGYTWHDGNNWHWIRFECLELAAPGDEIPANQKF